MFEDVLTKTQVCTKLGISEDQLWRACRERGFPYVQFGRTKLFHGDAIEEWMYSNMVRDKAGTQANQGQGEVSVTEND